MSLAAKQEPLHQSEVTVPDVISSEVKTFRRASCGDVAVIRDFAFELVPETFTRLIGPGGRGKTMMLWSCSVLNTGVPAQKLMFSRKREASAAASSSRAARPGGVCGGVKLALALPPAAK